MFVHFTYNQRMLSTPQCFKTAHRLSRTVCKRFWVPFPRFGGVGVRWGSEILDLLFTLGVRRPTITR